MNRIKDAIDKELSDVTFDSIDKERFGELSAGRKDKRPMKLNKKIIALAAAAAAALCAAVSVGAATGWDYGRLIRRVYPKASESGGNSSAASTDSVARALDGIMSEIPPENISGGFDNYDVSFDGVVCDGTAMMLSATIRAKDGTPFDADSRYTVFFDCEGAKISSYGCKVAEDGSLSAKLTCGSVRSDHISVDMSYLLRNSEELKKPQDPEELPPETVLDTGVVSAEFDAEECAVYKDFVLTDGSGKVMNMHITPVSVKVTFDPDVLSEDVTLDRLLFEVRLYGKDGEPIEYGICGGTGHQGGQESEDEQSFINRIFSEPMDLDSITGASCGDFRSE